jgi:hypothetical protein
VDFPFKARFPNFETFGGHSQKSRKRGLDGKGRKLEERPRDNRKKRRQEERRK